MTGPVTDPLADWWVHTAWVARLIGAGPYGDVHDTPAPLDGFVDDSNQMVRDSTGNQVVSSARLYTPVGTPTVPLGSLVTLPTLFGGRTSKVIGVSVHDAGPLPLPVHTEIVLE